MGNKIPVRRSHVVRALTTTSKPTVLSKPDHRNKYGASPRISSWNPSGRYSEDNYLNTFNEVYNQPYTKLHLISNTVTGPEDCHSESCSNGLSLFVLVPFPFKEFY